jgi:hypothetical protein
MPAPGELVVDPTDQEIVEHFLGSHSRNTGFEVLKVDPEAFGVPPTECDFAGLPYGSRVRQLHVDFVSKLDRMQSMSERDRGRFAGRLLLSDWLTLIEQTSEGKYNDTQGFWAQSPVVRPVTLRRLGAKVKPSRFTTFEAERVADEHKEMTGREEDKRPVFEFYISHSALIKSKPVATRLLGRLR